ncbi:DUF2306 domain-containing protein [Herpetosiphon llansteffanensis]|uniref:DUF2306 domain-containing protein n=1 Tax=Herpetosiphon llansteffanensis TaxID=2094568 RepID=UPI000D7C4DE5|nr:DUF2306 domain-containing protein [Herpetosiphon llansteffanensis]
MFLVLHIIGALVALGTGLAAYRWQNGTNIHRWIGKGYLLGWVTLFSTGIIISRQGITAPDVLNGLGMASASFAYGVIFLRKRLGRRWLRLHYQWMSQSYAFVCVATLNQLIARMGIEINFWIFAAEVSLPFFILPYVGKKLDQRYGFASKPKPLGNIASN